MNQIMELEFETLVPIVIQKNFYQKIQIKNLGRIVEREKG